MEPPVGIEPTTFSLRVSSETEDLGSAEHGPPEYRGSSAVGHGTLWLVGGTTGARVTSVASRVLERFAERPRRRLIASSCSGGMGARSPLAQVVDLNVAGGRTERSGSALPAGGAKRRT